MEAACATGVTAPVRAGDGLRVPDGGLPVPDGDGSGVHVGHHRGLEEGSAGSRSIRQR